MKRQINLALPGAGGVDRPETFASGLITGLTAAGAFITGAIRPPRVDRAGLESDWERVGAFLMGSAKRHGDTT